MSDWCHNRLEITGKSALISIMEEWISGEAVPLYRHAVMRSIKLFLAGCGGLLRPVKTESFPPFPGLMQSGTGQGTPANLAFDQWLGLLRNDVPLDGQNLRKIERLYHQSGIDAIRWDSIPDVSRRHIARLIEERYADWFGIATFSREIDPGQCWERLSQLPDRAQPCDMLQIIPSRLAAELNGSGGLLSGTSTSFSLYCRQYGMEWPAGHNVSWERDGVSSIKLAFDSTWFPPAGEVIAALSSIFDCEIRHWYSEPVHDLDGYDCYDRGEHVCSAEAIIDELDDGSPGLHLVPAIEHDEPEGATSVHQAAQI
ncbi:DUF1281 domain-containing protein [Pantoea agglomerans]|uniref:DUF1281 domain-containing protein n=1 Tax=Enterobacter agglomerans TaxID=549 RepID=UPI0028995A61|nr:DUF1281 domain-containing protein [Pantoea agglomerans]WNK42605.1 DUF1281 domain-containing protein [Pantoea agglomerans]